MFKSHDLLTHKCDYMLLYSFQPTTSPSEYPTGSTSNLPSNTPTHSPSKNPTSSPIDPVTSPPTPNPVVVSPTPPPQPVQLGYVLLPGASYSQCPTGRDVPQADCLAAANELTSSRTTIVNRGSLMVHDWNFTPCGCFVWANQMLDYDTNCANAVNSASSELVCLSVSSTKRANSFFCVYCINSYGIDAINRRKVQHNENLSMWLTTCYILHLSSAHVPKVKKLIKTAVLLLPML